MTQKGWYAVKQTNQQPTNQPTNQPKIKDLITLSKDFTF